MLRELILSVVSGLIIAGILQIFGGRGRSDTAPRQSMRNNHYAPPRRRSFFGGLIRLVLAVAGGIIFAQAVAPFLLRGRFGDFDGFDRFDRFDGFDGWFADLPILVLTVIGTIIVWVFLRAVTRR